MENSIKMIKQIEQTHKGLGIPILFGNLAVLARCSIMYIGEMGIGKGTVITSIKPLGVNNGYDLLFDTVTLTEMASRIANCDGINMLWRMKEWGTMSRYHRELFLTVGAKIITDHEFYHQMGEKKGVPIVIDIKDTNLVALIGITPLKFARMMAENENWASLGSDRFLKFILYNPVRDDTITSPPRYDLFGSYQFTDLPINTPLTMIPELLSHQISEDRKMIYSRALLRAYCIFEGKTECTPRDEIDFIRLFKFYLEGYGNFIYSTDIEEEPHLAVGGLRLFATISRHEGISMEELLDSFGVYEGATIRRKNNPNEQTKVNYREMIMRHAKILLDKDMITITHNSPDKFYLSKRYQTYFDWYRGITN